MIKLLLIGDVNSPHLIKWSEVLTRAGVNVFIWSMGNTDYVSFKSIPISHIFTCGENVNPLSEGGVGKLAYLKKLPELWRVVKKLNPDIIHAHYASSYGLLSALLGRKPLVISVWGSDIMSFPRASAFHGWLIRKILNRADIVQASGNFLKEITEKYCIRKVKVVNFGLEDHFFSEFKETSLTAKRFFTIGTVKSLEDHYDIQTLVKAFVKLKKEILPSRELTLFIVGDGTLRNALELLAQKEGVEESTIFAGRVQYADIAKFQNMIDLHICPSKRESFGVSILEAMALKKPVICSDIPAFDELITDGETGIRFQAGNVDDLCEKMRMLISDDELRNAISSNAFERAKKYKLEYCVDEQIKVYKTLLSVEE